MICFFFSRRRRHTRCAVVTGVQTCALPIYRADLVPNFSGQRRRTLMPADDVARMAIENILHEGIAVAQPRLQRRRRHHDAGLPAIEIDGTPEEFEILADRFGVIWTRMREMYGLREGRLLRQQQRSEEHTSELQSLMSISYAVFCLTKK